jgi:hypothetical protein
MSESEKLETHTNDQGWSEELTLVSHVTLPISSCTAATAASPLYWGFYLIDLGRWANDSPRLGLVLDQRPVDRSARLIRRHMPEWKRTYCEWCSRDEGME